MGRGQSSQPRSRPTGVVILSIVAVISGVQMLLSSVWALAISANADKPEVVEALSQISPEIASRAAGLFFFVGLVFIVLGVSSLLLARGYYRGQERARRRGRTISAFAVIWAVFGILLLPTRADPGSPWWTILINLVIIVYLGRDSIKGFFRS